MATIRQSLAACALTVVLAAPWNPAPPCSPPAGVINPAVNESMCFNTLTTANGVSIRQAGLPLNETLVVNMADGSEIFVQALPSSLAGIFNYFSGANDEQMPILSARTVPITVRPPTNNGTNNMWVVGMMVSTAQFPDSFKIPKPYPYGQPPYLQPVGQHTLAVASFTTQALPEYPDFEEACGGIMGGLPSGYTIVNSSWSPTWVIYNADANTGAWTNECWMEVTGS